MIYTCNFSSYKTVNVEAIYRVCREPFDFWLPLLSLLTSFCFGLAPTFGFDAGVMLALAMFFLAFVSLILLGACLATSRAPLRPPQLTPPGPTPP